MQHVSHIDNVPPELLEACARDAVLLSEHGIVLGETACPACGVVYTERGPGSYGVRCGCSRPTDRRCDHRGEDGRRDCRTMVPPEKHGPGWYHGDGLCDECRAAEARKARVAQLDVIFEEASAELRFSRDYSGKTLSADDRRRLAKQRKPLDDAMRAWMGSNCGRDDGARPWVIAIGPTGVGKTIGFIRYSAAAYLGGMIDSLVYVTEDELLAAISRQWSKDQETQDDAVRLVSSVRSAGVLIMDEAGKRSLDEMTPAQRREYPAILKRRIDSSQPVLAAMNRELSPGGPFAYLDARLDSRCANKAAVVRLQGVDLRRPE